MNSSGAERESDRATSRALAGALLGSAVVVFAVAVMNQHAGHDWGDDFSFYLRQTQALTRGDAARVLADNRFTVDNSSWHSFSPYSYPWGFPLLLSPFFKVFGASYAVFKVVIAACLAGAVWCYGRLLITRVPWVAALMMMLLIGLSSEYIGWADTVLSEFPYLFAAFGALCWMDRCRQRGWLDAGPWWPRVVLGLLVGYAYTVRKEGLAVVVALAALHLVHLIGLIRGRRRPAANVAPSADASPVPAPGEGEMRPGPAGLVTSLRAMRWRRLATPYAAALGWIMLLQVALPNGGYQSFPGTGLGQVMPNAKWYRDILAQQIGLKKWGQNHLSLWGSETLGLVMLTVVLTLAAIGVVARMLTSAATDAPVIGYFAAVIGIFGVTPFHEGRYLFSITPLLVYFAYQAVVFIADALPRPTAPILAAALIAPLLATNLSAIWDRTEAALQYDATIWGPEFPTAKEMFAAVEEYTADDDVVAFFRARLMTFETDRRALQLTTFDEIATKADWYAMAKDSTYSQYLLTDEQAAEAGFVRRWENQNFVLWQVPRP